MLESVRRGKEEGRDVHFYCSSGGNGGMAAVVTAVELGCEFFFLWFLGGFGLYRNFCYTFSFVQGFSLFLREIISCSNSAFNYQAIIPLNLAIIFRKSYITHNQQAH